MPERIRQERLVSGHDFSHAETGEQETLPFCGAHIKKQRVVWLIVPLLICASVPALAQTKRKVDGKPANQMQVAPTQPQDDAQPVAIRGGKLLTITHGVIDNGTVVMENGKIT